MDADEPLTPEELALVKDLPNHQPGCPDPGCFVCAVNKKRTAALEKMVARLQYLEQKVLNWQSISMSADITGMDWKEKYENLKAASVDWYPERGRITRSQLATALKGAVYVIKNGRDGTGLVQMAVQALVKAYEEGIVPPPDREALEMLKEELEKANAESGEQG